MTNLKQIARDLGISTATVSNALTGKGRVSEDMAQRIRDHAASLGYRPSVAARALKTGQSGILGLVMPDLTNPLFPRIAQHLSTAAEARGLGILIGDSRGDATRQGEAIQWLIERGVDGLVVVPQKGTSPEVTAAPTVIVNTVSDPRSTVSADHPGGGALMGAHIAGLGHCDVVLLGGDPVSEVQQDRIAGMANGLGAGVRTRIVWGDGGIATLAGLAQDGATAVLATSDLLALAALSHLMRAGLRVPQDISLTGFDDLPLATAMHPALTTVAQDVEAIADHALDVLVRMIAGQAAPPVGRAVAMRAVIRHSTAPAKRKSQSQPPETGNQQGAFP